MDEYFLDVVIDGYREKIKIYTNSIENAVDAMVSLVAVESILTVVRTKDSKRWNFNDGELDHLREIRGLIDNEGDTQEILSKKEYAFDSSKPS
jgi:hypothetical protein